MIKEFIAWRRQRRIDRLRIRAVALDEQAKALYDVIGSGNGSTWDKAEWIATRKKAAAAYAELKVLE